MSFFEEYERRYPALVKQLVHAAKTGRFAHAYLVHADSPETRRGFVLALAELAACPESRDGRPCGVCRICRQIENGTYSELYRVEPTGKMGMIQVGERINPEPNTLRYFESQLGLTGISGGRRKIGIIDEADRLNDESQNALLKTLEEPPRDTLLILASGRPAALLPTTRSRCQELLLLENHCSFRPLPELCRELAHLTLEPATLLEAEETAEHLIKAAAELNKAAEAETEAAWSERIEQAKKVDPAFGKRVEEQRDNAASGAYRRERDLFLASLHTFMAQLLLLACGARREDLPNPEQLEGIVLPAEIDADRAEKGVRLAEELLYTLRFNVSDELALRTFAVSLIAP